MMNYWFLTFYFLLFFINSLNGQIISRLGNPTINEYAYAVTADNESNSYLGGVNNNNGLIVKVNNQGNIIWQKSFTPTIITSEKVDVTFLDIIDDTLFGCGWISNGSTTNGTIYFKMDKNTGNFYWLKSEKNSGIYFSSMRYYQGKYVLSGAQRTTINAYDGKVVCVNSNTGNIIWQSDTKGLKYPLNNIDYVDDFMAMSHVVNDKFYLTGRSYISGGSNLNMRITVLGFDINGNVILNKYFLFPETQTGINRFYGMNIDFDNSDSLVVAFFGDDNCTGSCNNYKVGILKMDLFGNVEFSKTYDFLNSSQEYVKSLNITNDSYVLFGGYNFANTDSKSFVLKLDKFGVYQSAKLISKSGNGFPITMGNVNAGGSSKFINNMHYFCSSVHDGNANFRDMFLLQLDEDLNTSNQCYEVVDVSVDQLSIPPFSDDLIVDDKNRDINSTNNFNVTEYSISSNCSISDIIYDIDTLNCNSVTFNVSSQSNIFYNVVWSNGVIGNMATFVEDTTVYVSLFNSLNCCYLVDTLNIQIENNSYPELILPLDTTICTANGELFEINPMTLINCSNCLFQWQNGQASESLFVDTTGLFVLTITNECGLSDIDSIQVTVKNFPSANFINDTIICESIFPVDINLNSQNASNIIWSTGDTSDNLTINFPGIYTVELSNSCGTLYDTISINSLSSPVITPIPDFSSCIEGDSSVQLEVQCLNCDLFYINDILSTTTLIETEKDSTFTIYANNQCGTDSIFFDVDLSYFPEVEVDDTISICSDNFPVIVEATIQNADNIEWSNGDDNEYTFAENPGYFYVEVINSCGSILDSIFIEKITEPSIMPINNIDTCLTNGEEIEIPLFCDYCDQIYVNEQLVFDNQIISYSDSTYIISGANTCYSDTLMFFVEINYPPINNIPEDTCFLFFPQYFQLRPEFASLLWDNSTDSILLIENSGTYYFEISNECAQISDSITINAFPSILVDHYIDTCLNDNTGFYLNYNCLNCYYLNELTSYSDSIYLDNDGIYFISASNQCGLVLDSVVADINYVVPSSLSDTLQVCEDAFYLEGFSENNLADMVLYNENNEIVNTVIHYQGWYFVEYDNTCSNVSDSIYFEFLNEIPFYAPNSFTPDGDENNNEYKFYGDVGVINSVQIYNRWGEVIYEETNGFSGWDGTYNGQECQDGLYVVDVNYIDCTGLNSTIQLHVNLLK